MERKIILLAALLHDIGKFWQGTGVRGTHGELSGRFIREYVPEQWQRAAGIAAMHHDPSARSAEEYKALKTIMCADWLSSSERRELSEDEEGKRKDTPLRSIFSDIDIGKAKPSSTLYYPVKKLELDRNVIFPRPLDEISGRLKDDYTDLWSEFVEDVKKIKQITDFDAYFNTLYQLLQKYTWCVPSAVYRDVPDVSLFDHLKTTCAIASCLYNAEGRYLDTLIRGLRKRRKNEGLNEEEEEVLNKEIFLLVGGDVSGVQKFIYSIISKGAAKGLRGRSFYLELLSESIATYVLRELNLPVTNLLYCGGGHFYILAPSAVEENLEKIRALITERLLDTHKGDLYLVLDWLPLTAVKFQKESFGKTWEDLGAKVAGRKKRKFAEILEHHEKIFGPLDEGGTTETCEVCGSEENVKEEEERQICAFCKSLESLAGNIARANYWYETWKTDVILSDKEKGSWKEALSKFGVEYQFDRSINRTINVSDADHILVYKLNNINFSDIISDYSNAKSPISFGFTFLAKNTPYKDKEVKDIEGKSYHTEEIKDFHDLAEESEGITNWAVLRADVDNLGKIFSKGLGEDRTISRISTLSSMLSLFFKGWMERICEDEEFKNGVYAIYSGGDDLFVVGSWDKMPELGTRIYNDFRAFTCDNLNITLSAGIAITPSEKYPLYQAANLAYKALDKSKNLEWKDSVTFLDMPLKWVTFCDAVTALAEKLRELLDAGVSRGFLQKLREVYDEYGTQRKKHGEVSAKYDDRYGRWRWLLAYLIARTKVSKGNKALLKETEELIRKNIEHLSIAVRWVEFLTRKE